MIKAKIIRKSLSRVDAWDVDDMNSVWRVDFGECLRRVSGGREV